MAYPSLLLVIGQSNSILTQTGAQAHERLWERTRRPGGTLPNTLKLVEATRAARQRVAWTRYEIFRQAYPQTLVDRAQYDHWMADKADWTDADRERDAGTVDDIQAVQQPEDATIFYSSLGNVFLGTMLTQHLAAWGVRTILLAGYHLDWCIEQAARTARDIGFNPIVVGDATACGRESDETPTLERIDTFFAPVISTAQALACLAEGASRRDARGWPA
ncbi:isochorismatase family protein [Allostella humosa]|uniref:isochorismatase family protein n=1 Tax=Stella humosa TaxID=94 RepID=UPI0014772670|nr:isochorismatase family protein [Stella humosa]